MKISREKSNLIRQIVSISGNIKKKYFTFSHPSDVFHNQKNVMELQKKFEHLNSLTQQLKKSIN